MPDRSPAPANLPTRLARNRLSRRDTLWLLAAATTTGVATSGCSTSPVSGQRILVGLSPAGERAIDQAQAPHQFSQDLGAVQDAEVNGYVNEVMQRMVPNSHRPDMPYNARVLNANYVNAYTFPAGAMGVTRGILVDLKDESELAALVGHEMGHVNARHAAQRQGQSMLAGVAVAGLMVAAGDQRWAPVAGLGAQLGASALLASYSRENEHEADALGQRYMVAAGYPASGMTQLHGLLVDQERAKPGLLQTMFASHPMSDLRRDNARQAAETTYASSLKANPRRERFMDLTANLRRIEPTITACQNGETAMGRKAFGEAEGQFSRALQRTPRDYAANVRMAQCQQALGRNAQARQYADAARNIYPSEAQAAKLGATLKLALRQPAEALDDLNDYDRLLPGDLGVVFLKGVSHEAMGHRASAAAHYSRYLQAGGAGAAAGHAQSRLKAWGG